MKSRMEKWGDTAPILALVLLVAAGWLSYQSVVALIAATQARDHTLQVLAKLSEVRENLTEAETAARGHVITRQESYRVASRAALVRVGPLLTELREIAADDLDHGLLIDALIPMVRDRLGALDEVVRLPADAGDLQVAAWTNRGQRELDAIRQLLAEMKDSESGLLQARDSRTRASARDALIGTGVTTFLALLLVLGAGLALRRELSTRRGAEADLRNSQELLEGRVAQRTAELTQANQALRESEDRLRLQEARVRSVLDTAVDGIITIDTAGIIETFNRAAEQLFGYGAAEVIGKNVALLMPTP